MSINLTEISQKVLDNNTNAANVFKKQYDLHYNSNAIDVPFEYIDENGIKQTTNIPNVAKFRKRVWDDVGAALGQFNRTFYVDAENGDDNNDGSSGSPFKTIKKACDSAPVGGFGLIYLLGSTDYIIDNDIKLFNKYILLHGTYLDRDAKPILKNIAYTDAYGNATKGFYLYNSLLHFEALTIQTANYIDADAGDSYYQGFIKRYGAGIGKVITDGATVHLGDTSFVRESDRQVIDCIFYDRNRGYEEDYSFDCNGDNKNALLVWNESGDFRITANNIILGKDKDGNDLTWNDLVSGIIKDADSGNPINLISNINFSD